MTLKFALVFTLLSFNLPLNGPLNGTLPRKSIDNPTRNGTHVDVLKRYVDFHIKFTFDVD